MQPKTISKQISLEPFKTRYPVCFPSLRGGEIAFLTPTSGDTLTNAFYNCIPLGISEDITGPYSDFTNAMHEAYHNKVIFCHTLQEWMNDFRSYFKLIYSNVCHGIFDSAEDYYTRTYSSEMGCSIGQEMDITFNRHGGEKFYNWLIDNYFVTLDFYREYSSISGECSYERWVEIVDNLPNSYMSYPEVISFLGKMGEWSKKYSGQACNTVDDCCECVDYYNYGGDLTLELLEQWVERIQENINFNNESVDSFYKDVEQFQPGTTYTLGDIRKFGSEIYLMISDTDYEKDYFVTEENGVVYWVVHNLIPKACTSLSLVSKLENLGVFVSFSKEFIPNERYTRGQVCTYDDEIYILKSAEYQKDEFEVGDDWDTYYNVYIEQHPDEEDVDYETLPIFSGRTVSSLDSFTRKQDTVDVMGNTMPGYFKPNPESLVPHPAENALLDLLYQPGAYINLELLETVGGDKLYKCDLLERIEFYFKDYDGNKIGTTESTITSAAGGSVVSAITECIESAKAARDFYPQTLYADFHYCENTIIHFVEVSGVGVPEEIPGYSGGCISYIDHCTLDKSTCQYHLSETESYPVIYYQVQRDVEERYSDDYQANIRVCMCDFLLDPTKFGPKKHSASPLLRKEEFLPYVNAETPTNNIYIDRGYATVLDRHLRIGEISDYKQLEKYGNGIFQIFNSSEELV